MIPSVCSGLRLTVSSTALWWSAVFDVRLFPSWSPQTSMLVLRLSSNSLSFSHNPLFCSVFRSSVSLLTLFTRNYRSLMTQRTCWVIQLLNMVGNRTRERKGKRKNRTMFSQAVKKDKHWIKLLFRKWVSPEWQWGRERERERGHREFDLQIISRPREYTTVLGMSSRREFLISRKGIDLEFTLLIRKSITTWISCHSCFWSFSHLVSNDIAILDPLPSVTDEETQEKLWIRMFSNFIFSFFFSDETHKKENSDGFLPEILVSILSLVDWKPWRLWWSWRSSPHPPPPPNTSYSFLHFITCTTSPHCWKEYFCRICTSSCFCQTVYRKNSQDECLSLSHRKSSKSLKSRSVNTREMERLLPK